RPAWPIYVVRSLALALLAILNIQSDCVRHDGGETTPDTIAGWGISHLHVAFSDTTSLPNDTIPTTSTPVLGCPGLTAGAFENQSQVLVASGRVLVMDEVDPTHRRVFLQVDKGTLSFRCRKLNEASCNSQGYTGTAR